MKTKANPVPTTPRARTATAASQANSDRPSPRMPNGVVHRVASASIFAITATDPYRCWSGYAMLVANP